MPRALACQSSLWLTVLLAAACWTGGEAAAKRRLSALDLRRITLLKAVDARLPVAGEDPSAAKPNLALVERNKPGAYQDKALAVFGLMDAGAAPPSRASEANRLLRYAFHKWPVRGPKDLKGQYARVWNHASRSQAMRIYLLYAPRLEADVRREYDQRVRWLVSGPLRRSSENIRFTNNSAYFLAHEAAGATGLSTYGEVKQWLMANMRAIGETGPHEWGRCYLSWTMGAILNLAEFAQDEEVRRLASMVIDHYLAQLSGFVVNGNYGSGAVRMWSWTFSIVLPQTAIMRTLFPDCFEFCDERPQANWIVSNYRPLRSTARLFEYRGPLEAFLASGQACWRHYVFRRSGYLLAVNQAIAKGKFDLHTGGTHGIVGVFVQSAKSPRNCVMPFGCIPLAGPSKQRDLTNRYFGYKNVAFAQHGGTVRAVWAGPARFPRVPCRLFYAFGFERAFERGWAFLSDGRAFVAWRPTQGRPVDDPEAGKRTQDAEWGGKWLRSTFEPGPQGEVSIIEVGDAETFGSYDAFRRDVLARNPAPTWDGQRVQYKTRDGAIIEFRADGVKVDGRDVSFDKYPRARMPGLSDFTIALAGSRTIFDFDRVMTVGDARRVEAHLVFGAPPAK